MSEPTSYAYQWNRGGVPIPGATAQQYTVQTADANIVLTCTVYGINSATPSGVAVLSGPTAPVTVPTPVVAAAPPTLANGGFGFFNPNGSANLASDLTHVESVTGRHMDLVMEYANWDNGTSAVPTPTTSLLTACNGRPLMWTVQPSSGPYGATTANCVQWQSLIAGTYDSELTAFGTWVNANITGTIFVRFAHEANGTGYYDWQVGGTCGVTSAANYAAGFNHVAAVLKAASSKIVMVWAANNGPTANIGSFYPSGCDIMGFDSYNFGPNTSSTGVSAGGPSSTWQAAATLNAAVYAAVAACDPQKPIWVCETSCEEPSAPWTEPTSGVVIAAQTGVDKGQWVSAFLAETDMPRVAMVVWFDFQKERNWLVDSSTSSANAFYAGFSQSRSGAVYWNATNGGLPGYTPAGMAIGVAMGSDQTLFTASDKGLSQYQAMTAAGFAGVRIDLGVVNATPTTLNSSIDATIRAAVTAGLASRTVLILDGYHPNLITQANFVAFCVEAADTYSALGIHNFEIINEVNGNGAQDTSTGYVNPAAYAALLAAVHPAIHAADPLANVMFSGMPVFYGSDGPSEGSGNYGTPSGASFASLTPGTFLTLAYTAMGGSSTAYFDSMGAHPYCFPAAPSATNNWGILMNPPGTSGPSGFGSSVRQIMAANGDTAKPMWVTEFGYETSGDGSSVSTANQAAYLSQALTLAKGYRYVAGFMIFNWADDTDGDFGLVGPSPSYTAKPALATVETFLTPPTSGG
jgi:beta-mannanase